MSEKQIYHNQMKGTFQNGADEDLISVVMATFNEAPEIIKTSVKSMLDQTYQNFELLIYDDSTDEATKKTIDQFAEDRRVRIIRKNEKIGFVKALNMGLCEAKGQFIARMDGDDISFPDRIEKEVSFLKQHEDIYVLGGQVEIIDEDGKMISSRKYPLGGKDLFFFSAIRNPLAHPAVMMRRELIDQGFRYDESLEMSEDLDMWLRVMNCSYHIANLPDKILKYRVSKDFREKRTGKKQAAYMARVRWKNFNRKYFLHSCLSAVSACLFYIVPKGIIREMYDKENGQKKVYKNVKKVEEK